MFYSRLFQSSKLFDLFVIIVENWVRILTEMKTKLDHTHARSRRSSMALLVSKYACRIPPVYFTPNDGESWLVDHMLNRLEGKRFSKLVE